MEYIIHSISAAPAMDLNWGSSSWQGADTAPIDQIRPESTSPTPRVQAKILHDNLAIYGIFRVEEQFTLARKTGFPTDVYKDSCVEFFFKPTVGSGYFNLEIGAAGGFYMSYIRDFHRTATGFQDFSVLTKEEGEKIAVKTSLLPSQQEQPSSLTWFAQFELPLELLTTYSGNAVTMSPGERWTGNFYKCAEENSHPHWMSWSPVDDLNFHLPHCFGNLMIQ